jgi:Reverse transcriptase (RNA-dependent DNA polymerase)
MQQRLSRHMVANKYWNTSWQKGFLERVPGCIEHSAVLSEALVDAHREQRSICVAFLDLANAYGSVPHGLIQFALEWYHFPPVVCKLFHFYYDALFAYVMVPGSSTSSNLFQVAIGVFQGCTASTIIFNIVYNLMLDYVAPLANLGYRFSSGRVSLPWTLFADDLTLVSSNRLQMVSMLSKVQVWLTWTRSMKPKPGKCRAVAFRRFDARSTSAPTTTKLQSTQYSAYDPELVVGGQPIPCLWHKEFVFKFLGWWLQADLGDDQVRAKIEEKFAKLMGSIDSTLLNGMCKLWLYQHMVVTKMSWVLMIHDLPLSWVDSHITAPATRFLKKWSGLEYPANCNMSTAPRSTSGCT